MKNERVKTKAMALAICVVILVTVFAGITPTIANESTPTESIIPIGTETSDKVEYAQNKVERGTYPLDPTVDEKLEFHVTQMEMALAIEKKCS